MKRIIVSLFIVLILLLTVVSPVFAIADPDSPPSVNAVYVYNLTDGGVGVLIDYYLDYDFTLPITGTPVPDETVTEAFLAVFVDTDNVTQLKSVAPYTFSNSGYGRGAVWIRFTAAEVATYGITSADIALYRVWLVGNPTLAWAGVPPKTVATIDYWQPAGSNTATLLALKVLTLADQLELAWSLDMIEVTALGNRLTTLGASYFENVIPNLRTLAPACFSAGTYTPTLENIDYSTEYGAVMTNITGTVIGSPITFAGNTITGTADAGTATTLDDAILTQANNYWVGARLTIDTTTDGLAPMGETATITVFTAATDRLTFVALTALVDPGDTYTLVSGLYGTADAGTVTTIDDAVLEQADNYWNGARLVIVRTTDGGAPQGETALIAGFVAATNRLTFGALTATVDAGDTYILGLTDVNITVVGMFKMELSPGTSGILVNHGGTVTGSPIPVISGTSNITATGAGFVTAVFYTESTQTKLTETVIGTGFDLTRIATIFHMTRLMFSGLLWVLLSIIACASIYIWQKQRGSELLGYGATGPGNAVMLVFGIMLIGGTLLGMLDMRVAAMLVIGYSAYIGYIIFFRTSADIGRTVMFMAWLWFVCCLVGGTITGAIPQVSTKLTADITSTDTTITVRSTSGFKAPGFIIIGDERISFSDLTPTQFQGTFWRPVGRGTQDTTAAAHSIGDSVRTVENALLNNSLNYNVALLSDASGIMTFVALPLVIYSVITSFIFLPIAFLGTDMAILTYVWAIIGLGLLVSIFIALSGGRRV